MMSKIIENLILDLKEKHGSNWVNVAFLLYQDMVQHRVLGEETRDEKIERENLAAFFVRAIGGGVREEVSIPFSYRNEVTSTSWSRIEVNRVDGKLRIRTVDRDGDMVLVEMPPEYALCVERNEPWTI